MITSEDKVFLLKFKNLLLELELVSLKCAKKFGKTEYQEDAKFFAKIDAKIQEKINKI